MQIIPFDSKFFLVRSELGKTFSTLKAMPGLNKWKERDLLFKPTGANIEYLLEKFPDADWQGACAQVRDEYISIKQQEQNMRAEKEELLLSQDLSADNYEYFSKPYDHQRKSFLLARDLPEWGHLHEQGTGKTKILIDTTAYLFEKGEIDTAIIVAKNGVHINWVLNEIPKHLPKRIPVWAEYYSSSLSNVQYKRRYDQARMTHKKILRIITFNIEGFSSDRARTLIEHWLECSKSILIVDDGRIGNYKAERTKYMIKLAPSAKYRRAATGTPITKGVENLYSLFKFLNPLIIGHDTWTTFKNEFCVTGKFNNIIGYRNTEKLIKIVDGWSDRVLKVDCLDLPPKVYVRRPFEMSAFQTKLYDAYKKDALLEVQQLLNKEGEHRAAELAITKALRLHQIACGWTPDKPALRLEGTNPRMEALFDELAAAEEAEAKTIIWARFSGDLEEIAKRLGSKCVIYVGATGKDHRIRAITDFQNNPKVLHFVGHTQAAGTGLTLTAATRTVYHSNMSDLELRLQSEDRNHRIGTTSSVTYTDLEAFYPDGRKTIDRRIINALRAHKKLSEEILRDPTSLFMEE